MIEFDLELYDTASKDRICEELTLMDYHDYSKWEDFFNCLEVLKELFDEENVTPYSKGTIGASYIAYLKGYSIVNSLEYDIFPEFFYGNSYHMNDDFSVEYFVPKGFKQKAVERFKEKGYSIFIPLAASYEFGEKFSYIIIIDECFKIALTEYDIWIPKDWYEDFANNPESYLSGDGLSFAERVRLMSFELSSYVDEKKALFADRDEAMRKLVDHGYYYKTDDWKIDRKKAFEVTEYVRKGFAHSAAASEGYLEVLADYFKCDVDDLKNIKHLTSRAKSVSYVIGEIYQGEK